MQANFDYQTLWINKLQDYWNQVSEKILQERNSDEELSLNLAAENSLFVRLNSSRIRQNTSVEQKKIEVVYQKAQRRVYFQFDLTFDLARDIEFAKRLLGQARQEAEAAAPDQFISPFQNNGKSNQVFESKKPSPSEIFENLTQGTLGSEFTGLLTLGPVVRANRNHLGQEHWFATEQFFIDYSLYTKNSEGENKAVKSSYSGRDWDNKAFQANFQKALYNLQNLKKTSHTLKPGGYRTFLAPSAVNELLGMFSWNGVSLGAHKKGSSAFTDLFEGRKKLSPIFSLKENFTLGLSPRFNSMGEVPPETVELISGGELKSFLVSTRTAKETGATTNCADINSWGHEYLRSPEISGGDLQEKDVLRSLGTGLYLSQLHYINWSNVLTARVTGMTRFACFWVEGGEIISPIKDVRFDDTIFNLFGENLEQLTVNTSTEPNTDTYFARQLGGSQVPGALISEMKFTL
jgi:predicted Zn-dependent protease